MPISPPPLLPRRRPLWAGAEALGFLALAVLWTWPMVRDPAAAALGSADADGLKHLWTLWWARASVWQEGRLPFHTELLNWPVGMELYPIEPMSMAAAVLLPGMNLLALANLVVLLNLAATGWAGAWFGRQVSGSAAGGWAAGVMLQGSAAVAFFVHVGVGELQQVWWVPLGLGLLVRARQRGKVQDFLLLAAALAGSVLSGFYLGFFLAIGVAVWALLTVDAGRRTRRTLLGYAGAAALAMAVTVPVIRTFSASYGGGEAPETGLWAQLSGDAPAVDAPADRLALSQLFRSGRPLTTREEAAYGGGRYLGFLPLILGIAGLVRRPREGLPWAAVAVAGLLLALGSEARIGGETVRLPFLWVNRALGVAGASLHFPVRALVLTEVALVALVALALRGRWAVCALLAVMEVAMAQELAWPWARFRPQDSSALAVVSGHRGHAILDLALVWRSDAENRWSALSAQLVHGHAIQAVPLERIEYFARDGAFFAATLPLVTDLEPLYNRAPGGLARGGGGYRSDLALLRDAGFGELLVSYRGGRERMPDDLVAALTDLCGPPVAQGPAHALWSIPEVPATPEELLAWKAEHAAARAAMARSAAGMGRR